MSIFGVLLAGCAALSGYAAEPADPGAPPVPRLPLALTYTLQDPSTKQDKGGWTKSDYREGPEWKPAGSIREIDQAMRAADRGKVWFRFRMTTIVRVELAPDGTWRPAENYDVIPGMTY